MAFKMRYQSKGDSPWHKNNDKEKSVDNRKTARNPAEDEDWIRREVNRHKALNLDYKHLYKYMSEEELAKYKNK
tara:strand:- start:1124 stop:1345 length:222 start_codon:yes stop_codon:yes gene_type:complete